MLMCLAFLLYIGKMTQELQQLCDVLFLFWSQIKKGQVHVQCVVTDVDVMQMLKFI